MSALPIRFKRPQSVLAVSLCVPYSGWLPGVPCRQYAFCGAFLSLLMPCVRWWHLAAQCWIILLVRSR
jgi:hypothetical protein